jgi:hypothetical protein
MERTIKVYVGCSLTHAPQEFRDSVENLKNRLKEICQVLAFKGLSDSNLPHDVYVHDIIGCVHECDLLVAICDYPSLGLGWEMSVQAEVKKGPVLAVAHKDSKISKLVLDPRLPGYEFHRYENLCEDVYNLVLERINSL